MPEFDEIDDKTAAVFKKKGYKVLKPLGKGNFGTVFKAVFIKTGDFAAVKVMDLNLVDDRFKNKFLPREMAAMIEAKHKNCIQLYDIIRSNKKLYIFMEFAANGDLMGVLKKHKSGIPLDQTNYWFRQSVEGLNYLHNSLNISHRDIKVDNILLDEQNNAKISDFGFARKSYDVDKGEVILSKTMCGTREYQCPEILKKEPYDPYKADIWAMGIVLVALLMNRNPYTFGDSYQTNKQMEDPDHLEQFYTALKKKLCKHVRHLIRHMLAYNPEDRYDIRAVLDHKWIQTKAKCCDNSV